MVLPLGIGWTVAFAAVLATAAAGVDSAVQGALAAVIIGLLILLRNRSGRGVLRLFYIGCLMFVSLRYFLWRTTETLTYYDFFSFVASLLLFGAEVYAVGLSLLGVFASVRPIDRTPPPLPDDPERLPSVDVFIPTYNEAIDLLETTVLAAVQIRYPEGRLRVYVLDDGGTEQKRNDPDPEKARAAWERHHALQRLCRDAGATYLTRARNQHAKSGNINAALRHTSGDLVLILDADHVPTVDILERTVGLFVDDPKLFLVQTPHFFINPDPIEKNLGVFGRMPSESEMFFRIIQRGLDFWNAALFAGSAAILRRAHLEEIGGLSQETITEDAETALELHARGYRSAYLARPLVSGLSPETFTGFIIQRMRWAQGMVQILLLKNLLGRRDLTVWQRLCYLSNCAYWFFPFARVVFLLAPTMFLFFGLKIYDASGWDILTYTIPQYWTALQTSNFLYGKVRWPFVSQLYEMLQSMFSILAVWQVLRNPRSPSFKVTPKGEQLSDDFVSPLAGPFYVITFILLLGYVAAGIRFALGNAEMHVLGSALAWHTLNFLIIVASLGALFERRQRRGQPRVEVDLPGVLVTGEGAEVPCRLEDISTGGSRIVPRSVDAALAPGAVLTLRVANAALGRETEARVEVLSRFRRGADWVLGTGFRPRTHAEKAEIVALVHGDSERWVRTWTERRGRPVGVYQGLSLLVWLGLRQAFGYTVQVVRARSARVASSAARAARSGLRRARPSAALRGLLLGAAVGLAAAGAARDATAEDIRPLAEVATFTFALQEFMPEPEPITLRNDRDEAAIYVPLSERFVVTKASMRLKFVNSIGLLGQRSQIRLAVNGAIVAQMPLVAEQPRVEVEIFIPPELLVPGYNRISFETAQHYTNDCEDPGAPELWTQIDTKNSSLGLEGSLVALDPHLSDLPDLVNPSVGTPLRYRILTPARLDDDRLTAGARVAEAVGLRLQFRPALFSHELARTATVALAAGGAPNFAPGLDQRRLPGADTFLLGTREELAPYLSEAALDDVAGPYLAIHPLPADPRYFVAVVSGTTTDEVLEAAAVLNYLNFPFADARGAVVRLRDAPRPATFGNKRFVETGTAYSFEALGFRTETRKGSSPQDMEITFELPPDFYVPERANVLLKLDFAYGANLRGDSVANIYLNEKFERAIPLNNANGAILREYEVPIALRSFRPGRNVVRIEAVMVPSINEKCVTAQSNNLLFTLFDTSTLEIPEASRYAAQPDLELFAQTGFPYAHAGEHGEAAFALLSDDADTVAAAWAIAAKLAQVADAPRLDSPFRFGVAPEDRHLIVVGPLSELGDDLRGATPLGFGGEEGAPYPRGVTPSEGSWLERRFGDLLSALGAVGDAEARAEPVRIGVAPMLDRQGVATAFQSPYAPERVVTLFAAASPAQVRTHVERLVGNAMWGQMAGDVTLWTGEDDPVWTQRAGAVFHIGEIDVPDLVRYHLSNQPLWFIGGALGLIMALAFLTRLLLIRLGRRLHGKNVDAED